MRLRRRATLLAACAALAARARAGEQLMTLSSVTQFDARAVCNDGSDAGYYYSPATGQPDVWLVMLEGGEWCYDIESCNARMVGQSTLMGSSMWHREVGLSGIFETDATKSPFAAAHKVYVPYCSSDAWVGDTDAGGLLFRGQAIVRAVLASLVAQLGLGAQSGDRLLFGGCSAGARGAAFTLDYVSGMLADAGAADVEVQGMLDSPLWIDVAPLATTPLSLQCQTQAAVTYLNATGRLGETCVEMYSDPSEQWRCLFGEYRLPTLRTPYALNAAQYDTFQLEYALGGTTPPQYPDQYAYADAFGAATLAVVSALPAAGQAGSGVFSSACFHHCVTLTESFWGIQSEGVTLSEALRWWFFGGCPQQDCPGGLPTQVIEHCDEGFQACKNKCSIKRSTKGGKHKQRPPKAHFQWSPGMATPPAPYVPLVCQSGPQPQVLQD